ncbi:hypothetical protein [Pseudomonas juntendi]|uniref:hypothetical protein n=1 Tax=Pseudomonas juntendi TaxID=2666183 RepID=UPI0034667024
MSQTDQAIASLRSSIEVLHAIVAGIQAQVGTKVDTTALAALNSRITACERKISVLGTPVTAQGTSVKDLGVPATADCHAVPELTSRITGESNSSASVDQSGYITGEKPARQAMEESVSRAEADLALAKRIGSFECSLRAGSVKVTLASDAASTDDQAAVDVDLGKAIEPLHMGKVTFYGESARAIRDAQEVLRAAGAGQLEVVKREDQGDSPFAVIDGRVFMPQATIKDAAIDPARISVKVAMNEQGQYVAAGFGVDVQDAEQPKAFSADDLLNQISAQISESKLGTALAERVALIEQSVGKQGGENRAVHDWLVGLASRVESLTALAQSEVGVRVAADSALGSKVDALQAQLDNLQSKVYSGS